MYKLVFKNNRTTSFNSLEEMRGFLGITEEEVNELLSGKNLELRRKLGIKTVVNGVEQYLSKLREMNNNINKGINSLREGVKGISQTVNSFLGYVNENKLVLSIVYKLGLFNEEYKKLKQEGKVKGIGISLPLGSGDKLDGDSYKLDYVLRVLRKYDGFEELGETPLLLFTPHYSTYMKTTYSGNIDEIYWIGIDNEMIVSPYGFNIHNHLNPTTYNHKREINMNVELIKKIRSGEGVELGKLHTNIERFPLGTMVLFLSLLNEELTEEEFKELITSDSSHIISKDLGENKIHHMKRLNINNYEERVKDIIYGDRKYSLYELHKVFSWFDGNLRTVKDRKFKSKRTFMSLNSNNYKFEKEENCVGEHFYTENGFVIQFQDTMECV